MSLRLSLLFGCAMGLALATAAHRADAKPPDSQPSNPPAAQPLGPQPPQRPAPTAVKPVGPQPLPPPTKTPPNPAAAQPQPTVKLGPGEVPQIEFDTPIYDFGKMKAGKDIEHDFWFHNGGTGPLEILSVKPS